MGLADLIRAEQARQAAPTVASEFSGIGGFDLAFERAGGRVVHQCELDDRCADLLTKRFPNVELARDIREVGRVSADIVVGGFPCQDLSVAGRRAGLAGERSGLFHDFARVIEGSNPRWVVIENVAGLLSSNGGADFGTVLGSLVDIGFGVAWRVLDAQFFGVPQRRRRVFIVGHRGNVERARSVLFEREGSGGHPAPRRDAQAVVAALTRSGLGGGGPDDNLAQAGHLIAAQCHGTNVGVTGGVPFIGFHVTQDPITSSQRWPTLSTGNRAGCATLGVSDELGVRKLMPIECERLQGFPDGWTEGYADTTRYRMLGNAVAVPVVEWIARRLLAVDASRP